MAALNIAFEAPEVSHKPRPSGERPIDLVHLAHQTGGDKMLETEVLALFARQGRQAVAQIEKSEAKARADLAHKIAGAAKGVGAFEVVRRAQTLETRPDDPAAIAGFVKAIVDADSFIVGLTR